MSRYYYSREDVQTHYGSDRPAVNVKVSRSLADGYRDFQRYEPDADERFTLEWIEETFSDEYLDGLFWMTCEHEWEMVEQDAETVFGSGVTVERDGRSGGWAVVHGLGDIEEWDAIAIAKWRRFERYAKLLASDVPYQMVASLFYNEFERWAEEESERIGDEAFAPETITA